MKEQILEKLTKIYNLNNIKTTLEDDQVYFKFEYKSKYNVVIITDEEVTDPFSTIVFGLYEASNNDYLFGMDFSVNLVNPEFSIKSFFNAVNNYSLCKN